MPSDRNNRTTGMTGTTRCYDVHLSGIWPDWGPYQSRSTSLGPSPQLAHLRSAPIGAPDLYCKNKSGVV